MGNTYFLEKYVQMRRKEFLEAARLERLIQEVEAEKPKFWQKLIWKVGDWMIALGHRLNHEQTLMSKPWFSGWRFESAQDGSQNNDLYPK
jgi:hypothetical protein